MNVHARLKINSAYVLHADEVRKLWVLFGERIGSVQADALCADDIERRFERADDLAEYDNFQEKEIQSLSISARGDDLLHQANVRFSQRHAPYIEFTATGEESAVVGLKQHVANLANSIKPWYSAVSKLDFFYVFWVILSFLAIIFLSIGNAPDSDRISLYLAVVLTTGIVAFFIVTGCCVWLLNHWRSKYFPVATFAIGVTIRRHKFYENVRWVIFVGVAVSMFSSMVFALVWP